MAHVIVTAWNGGGRVTKFKDGYADAAAAADDLAAVRATFPSAFVAEQPAQGGARDWIADIGAGTLTYSEEPGPTNAEIAARITLSRIQFFAALATALSQSPETVATFIKTAITTAEGLAQISSGDAALARFFIDNANTFPRVDPNPAEAALLVSVGAILGLDEDAIDSLFIAAASA